MKKYILTLLPASLLFHYGAAQSFLNWGSEYVVAEDSLYGSTRPRIAVAGSGPVITWGGGNPVQVWSARWNGAGFDTPLAISPAGIEPYVTYWTSAEIAASGDTVFVVYSATPIFTSPIYIVRSTDGGISYSDTLRVDNIGADEGWLPTVGIGPGGNPAVVFMRLDSGQINPRWVVTNSLDGGLTFNADAVASGLTGTEVCECCPASITSEGQRQALLFRNNDNNVRDIWVTVSYDGGATFPSGADIDPNDWVLNACPSTGPDGTVSADSIYSVWMSGAGGPSRIWANATHLSSIQSGGAFKVADNVPANQYQRYPRIAGSNDTIGIVWENLYLGDRNAVFIHSTSGLQGLGSSYDTVNATIPGTQMNPDVAYANGVFHFTWTDLANKKVMYRSASVLAVGVAEPEAGLTGGVAVKPNPFSETATLEFDAPLANVEIYDLLHRRVRSYKQVKGGKLTIERVGLQAGVYFYTIRAGDRTVSGKLIVK